MDNEPTASKCIIGSVHSKSNKICVVDEIFTMVFMSKKYFAYMQAVQFGLLPALLYFDVFKSISHFFNGIFLTGSSEHAISLPTFGLFTT